VVFLWESPVNIAANCSAVCAVVCIASSGTTTTSGPGGPGQNGLVVSIVIGAFVMFVATVIGSVVST